MLKGKYLVYQSDSGIYDLRDSHTLINSPYPELSFVGRVTDRNLNNQVEVTMDVSSIASTGDLIILCGVWDAKANEVTNDITAVDAADNTALSGAVKIASTVTHPDVTASNDQPAMAAFYWIYDGSTTPRLYQPDKTDTSAGTALVFTGNINSVSLGNTTAEISGATAVITPDTAEVPYGANRLKVAFQSGRPGTSDISNTTLTLNTQSGYTVYDGTNTPDAADSMNDAYLILNPTDADSSVGVDADGSRVGAIIGSLTIT